MNFPVLNFEEANKNLIWILAVGIALGIGNYALGIWPTLQQSLVQQVAISMVIGYGLIFIVTNSDPLFVKSITEAKKYAVLIFLFALLGIVGTEIEGLIKSYAYKQTTYSLLDLQGGHLFNSILSIILGFVTLNWVNAKKEDTKSTETPTEIDFRKEPKEKLTAIPIRKGENILLHSIEDILYFEAYDNYAFLFDLSGKKHLCNYSLLFLEKKLQPDFLRVHRKYLINKNQITQIKPHLKGRFVIEFKDKFKTTITSSTSYTEVIKSLIKL